MTFTARAYNRSMETRRNTSERDEQPQEKRPRQRSSAERSTRRRSTSRSVSERSSTNRSKASRSSTGNLRMAEPTFAASTRQREEERRARRTPQRVNPVRRLINEWFDRLVGAVSDGDLAGQDEAYESGRTSRDFMWNTIGFAAWGMVFPVLTIVVTQLAGVERAGMFSFAFVMANLLYILGNYGVRTYQVSDVDEYHSFSDYQVNRIITCIIMMIVSSIITKILGYEGEMFVMCIGIFAFKAVDALGEVYEGRLQQVDKLYLGGISLTIRSAAGFVVFSLLLVVTNDLGVASVGMAIAAAVSFLFVSFPLTLFETPRSPAPNLQSIQMLFRECFPVFLALFLYAVIDNMPKFVMQGAALPYDNQLYFNALYFPAMAVLIIVGMIYKPLLVKMANVWNDPARRSRFDLIIAAMVAVIVAITVVGILIMRWIGIPIMSFLYGLDFGPYTQLSYIMLAAGGVTALIDFLYQVITILRRQQVVMGLYLITFGFSLLVLILMTTMMELEGAVVGYLIVMSILAILLAREYVVQRLKISRAKGRR